MRQDGGWPSGREFEPVLDELANALQTVNLIAGLATFAPAALNSRVKELHNACRRATLAVERLRSLLRASRGVDPLVNTPG